MVAWYRRPWTRDPLIAFLLLGGSIFAIERIAAPGRGGDAADSSGDAIVLTDALEQRLASDFQYLQGRAPDAKERAALIARWLEDEQLFREALHLNLHRSDAKVRARLIDTLRQLWRDTRDAPGEATLQGYFQANRERYLREPRLSFDQVFFAGRAPEGALEKLRAGETLTGDPFWLGNRLEGYGESILRSNFGGTFYELLWQAPLDQWIGPLRSPRGAHLVRLTGRDDRAPLPFEAARAAVLTDWQAEHDRAALRARLKQLEMRYPLIDERSRATSMPSSIRN